LQTDIDEVIEEEVSLEEFVKDGVDILNSENSAPVIKFVNSMFFQAIKKNASDIHIETHENFGLIRFRIDGVLITQAKIQKKLTELVINRIKVISNLDISEKRIPQDGRTQIKIANKTTDIRVSIIPTYFGEKAVMRILMESEDIPSLKELGFNEEITTGFKELLEHSYGMILVTGPTGSGKSTTLHSFLQTISTPEKNIITVEDPVEYKADNINQIQVNNKVGLTFAKALRSILRQDPDIIMVGEIRDKETASIAIQAALTGHLMLSTLHTNNAAATITRLMDMGIEPFLISSSLIGILSQRLVRRLCDCKEIDNDTSELQKIINKEPLLQKYEIKTIYKAKGCAKCNFTGYKGRKAVGELFIMNDEIKSLIANKTNDIELKQAMIKNGMKTLKEAIFEEVINGTTSLKEAIRVGLKD
jgi:general secretion pathway protein E